MLLIGVGGGSIVRVLAAALPPAGRVHSLELEPEVLQAAIDFFGFPVSDNYTSAAADGAAHMRTHCAQCKAGDPAARAYDVLLLDAFTSEGLSDTTQKQSTLDDAAGCLSPRGLLIVNLHTGEKDDPDDPDYYVARRVLRALCARFDTVYSILCASTQNLIAICHQGELLEADSWEARLAAQLDRAPVRSACVGFALAATMGRFDFVGGREQPMEDEPGVGELDP